MSWGEGNERLTGNFATKMTLDMITAFQRDTSLFKIENWNILEQTTMATHLGGIGVGGLRRRVDLHGLVDAQGLDLRGKHSQ